MIRHSAQLAAEYAGFKQINSSITDTVGGMVHLDDKKNPPLQAADMVASLGKEIALEYLKRNEQIPLPRMKGIFWKLVSWDKPSMQHLARLQPN